MIKTFFDKTIIINLLMIIILLFIGFGSYSNGFANNINIAYSFLYLFCVVLMFNGEDLVFGLEKKKFVIITLMFFSFSLSCFYSNFDSEIWYRLFCIFSSIFLGYVLYVVFKKNIIDFYGVNFILGLIGLVHVFVLLFTWFSVSDPENYNWVTGIPFFSNIRHLADFISICFFSALFVFIFSNNKKVKFLYLMISVFILACILWSGSRAAYVSVFFSSLIIFFRLNKYNKIYLLSIFSFAIISSLFFKTNNPYLGILRSFSHSFNGSVNQVSTGRFELYKEVLVWFSYKPLLGYGGEAVRLLNLGFLQAHNSVLQILIEFGFIGFIFVLTIFYIFYRDFKKTKLNNKQIFCISIVVNIIVASFFNGGAYYVVTMSLMCLYLAGLYLEKNKDRFIL